MRNLRTQVTTFVVMTSLCCAGVSAEAHEGESTSRWQPGVHYTLLAPANDTDVPPGKVEVLTLFLYTNGLSQTFHEHMQEWLKTKADIVVHRRQPAIVFPHARLQARLFYTLQALGREDLHPKVFEWIFDEERYPVYHTVRRPDAEAYFQLNLGFAKANGIDEQRFTETYNSTEIEDKVIAAEIDGHSYHIYGTTTVCIAGKYCTSVHRIYYANPEHGDRKVTEEDWEQLFELLDYLVGLEASG